MSRGASAPGKVILCGEYAVLEGVPAVVAAADRRVTAAWTDSEAPPCPPEAEEARALAEKAYGTVPSALTIGAESLLQDGKKLGLGSSSAAAVASAAAVLNWHGHDPEDSDVRRRVFELALAGHHAVAPHGSGLDVASATFGGVLRFRKEAAGARAHPMAWPEDLYASVIWTGTPVRTSGLVEAVLAFRDADDENFQTHMNLLRRVANHFVEAFAEADVKGICDAAAAYAVGMEVLGTSARVEIVTHSLRTIGRLAGDAGGAAKPSGAGGGDIAVGFFPERGRLEFFESKCRQAGATPLNLTLGEPGVRS